MSFALAILAVIDGPAVALLLGAIAFGGDVGGGAGGRRRGHELRRRPGRHARL